MKFTNIAIVILINLFLAIATFAAAPANDNFADAQELNGAMRVHISGSNIEATRESSEPNLFGNPGGKSVWFKWTAPFSRAMQLTTGRSDANLDTLLAVYSGTGYGDLINWGTNNNISSAASNRRSWLVFHAIAGTTYYITIDGYKERGIPTAEGEFRLDLMPYFPFQGADHDSDGKTDLTVFRPSTGDWLVNGSTRSYTTHWGTNGDIPVVGGLNVIQSEAVFRPSTGRWHLQAGTFQYNLPFGTNGDIPVMENFVDNTPNITVFRPSNGVWYIYPINTGAIRYYQFGMQGDIPVPGQYSPDQFADVAVFRPSNGVWYFMTRKEGSPATDAFRAIKFGQEGDKPVPADYDGDGLLDIAVYRPSTGAWFILRSSDSQVTALQFGTSEDIPSIGDYDNDGLADYGVFRPSNGTWYILESESHQLLTRQFGQTGDIPMSANRAY